MVDKTVLSAIKSLVKAPYPEDEGMGKSIDHSPQESYGFIFGDVDSARDLSKNFDYLFSLYWDAVKTERYANLPAVLQMLEDDACNLAAMWTQVAVLCRKAKDK